MFLQLTELQVQVGAGGKYCVYRRGHSKQFWSSNHGSHTAPGGMPVLPHSMSPSSGVSAAPCTTDYYLSLFSGNPAHPLHRVYLRAGESWAQDLLRSSAVCLRLQPLIALGHIAHSVLWKMCVELPGIYDVRIVRGHLDSSVQPGGGHGAPPGTILGRPSACLLILCNHALGTKYLCEAAAVSIF